MKKNTPTLFALDSADRRILKLLQKNNQLTNLQLAARVNLSPPTCLRRVRQLRENGVIVADVALLNPAILGKSIFVFIEVVMERQGDQFQQNFEKKVNQMPEVMQCYMVSGKSDFLLIVQVSDMDVYYRFVREVLTNDPNIRNFRSSFAMNRAKFRTELNLED